MSSTSAYRSRDVCASETRLEVGAVGTTENSSRLLSSVVRLLHGTVERTAPSHPVRTPRSFLSLARRRETFLSFSSGSKRSGRCLLSRIELRKYTNNEGGILEGLELLVSPDVSLRSTDPGTRRSLLRSTTRATSVRYRALRT